MTGKMKDVLKRILCIPILVSMLCVAAPGFSFEALAAEPIGSLNGTSYTNFKDLINDLEDHYEGQSVVIEMLTNWDAAEDGSYDERLIIPSNCRATLNMNGNVFDRDNTAENDSCFNGELILMESGSTLTINGGDQTREHSERIYTSTSRDGKASTWKTFYGGVLTGGANDNGAGAIHVKSACNLILNDVTIAGCRAHAPWYDKAGTRSAHGGGIWLAGGDTNLTLNNSTITGCFAYYNGGGIFQSNHNNVLIELSNSHIDANYAGDAGGGIDPDGEYIQIIGDGKSTVSNNQAAGKAGGIYAWNDSITISGLILEGNRAGTNGGGIYSMESTVSLNNLVIKDNYAAESGGGIYIESDGNTISSCKITGNSAGAYGHGVFVGDNVGGKFVVSGSTVIKENGDSNLFLSDSSCSDTHVKFSLTKGAEVWVRYYDGNHDSIMVTPGKKGDTIKAKDCTQYLFSDQDGYYFAFDSAPDMRKIMRVRGQREELPKPTAVPSSNANDASRKGTTSANTINGGVVGQVGAGGYAGTDYDLIRGFYIHEKSDSGTDDNTGVFYYSDGFFYGDEYTYNPHLGTASWILAFAGTCLRQEDEADENGNTYYNKHAGSIQFMADIGCPDQMIYVNDTMVHVPETDTIGVTIASKELAKADGTLTGDILIPVTVRGGGYESEWASNVTLGTVDETASKNNEAKGFADAADKVMKEIDYYLKKYDLEDAYKAGNVIFWVSGFSRAGATANLTSKRLVDRIAQDCTGDQKSRVFGYPCEAPKGGTDAAEVSGNNYQCIHNMINKVDVVPYVAPMQMGFKRYGVDHYIPGTDAGEVKINTYRAYKGKANGSSVSVTTYTDNEYTPTKTSEYDQRRALMLGHLRAIDSDMLFDDYFHPMAMDFLMPKMYEVGDYDENRAEDFVEDFIRFMQYGINYLDVSYESNWSMAVVSRDRWANELQDPMRDTMALLFSITAETKEGFMNHASTIMNKISYIGGSDFSMRQIYANVIGSWYKLSASEKEKYINFFWTKLEESGALEYLDAHDKANLKKNWPAIANFLFRFVDGDYNFAPANPYNFGNRKIWTRGVDKDKTMTYLPTFATFSSYILSCHNPEVNIAWAMTYDDYYQSGETNLEPTEYEITPPASVKAPEASVILDEEPTLLKEGADENNLLENDQKIILENEDIVGEAIYYDLYDVTGGAEEKIAANQLYLGGIGLVLGEDFQKSYRIETYDMSYKVKSEKAIYNINLTNSRHKVVVVDKDMNGTDRTTTSMYDEDVQATIIAGKPESYYFKNWIVSLLDQDGNVVAEDITDKILGVEDAGKADDETVTFTLPKAEGDYPEGYGLKFQAVYAEKIEGVNAPLEKPKEGTPLASTIAIDLGNGAEEYPITWTYTYEDETGEEQTVITSGNAYQETAYTATVRIDRDQAKGIVFADSVTVTTDQGTVVQGSVKTDPNDGSLTFSITFEPTGTDGGQVKPETVFSLVLNMVDLNLPAEESIMAALNYLVHPGQSITLSAPQAENEKFMNWSSGSEGIVISEADAQKATITLNIPETLSADAQLAVNANYMPIVNSFDVKIAAPKGGEALASAPVYMDFTVENTYRIDPACYELTWTPAADASGKAAFLTEYTAAVHMTPLKDSDGREYIKATYTDAEGTEHEAKFYTNFLYSDSLQINVLAAEEADQDRITCYSADTANNTVYIKFKPTNYVLKEVKQPDDISGLSHDKDNEEAVLQALPMAVQILTENGQELEAKVTWSTPERTSGGGLEAGTWTATGQIELPANVENTKSVPMTVSMTVVVNAADTVTAPSASISSGTYLADQYVTLSTETTGATIYYTLDGSDPSDENVEKYTYSGNEIAIKRADATKPEGAANASVVLRAVAVKDGMYSSDVATFEYTFSDEVAVPSGAAVSYNTQPQIGVEASPFYTLTAGDGVTIDEKGNAVATNGGTYTVTAKIKDGFKWRITKEDGTVETTTEDQLITFTIHPSSLKDAVVEVLEDPVRAEDGKAEPKIKVTLYGIELPEETYKAIYSNNTKKGTGKVIAAGDGVNLIDESEAATFTILPEKFTITFDLNGGTYDGRTGVTTEIHEDGETIKLLGAPTKEGYEFDYWKGSSYKAGAKYKVEGDHTFTAQWKTPDVATTGDSTESMIIYAALMLAALITITAAVIWRRKTE